MITATLSFHVGEKFNIRHNSRDNITVHGVDKGYEALNNYYHPNNTTLEDAYYELFEKDGCFQKYNASIRKSRQYPSYLEKLQCAVEKEDEKIKQLRVSGATDFQIKQCKKARRPAYEIIFCLGNREKNPEFCRNGDKQDVAIGVLRSYLDDFSQNNPYFHMVHGSIHTGEMGVCHCHLIFVPFTTGCTRGMERQTSLTGALRQMGFSSDDKENAITKWEDSQRKLLKSLAKARGIEIVEGTHSKKHLSTREYKLKAEAETVRRNAGELIQYQDEFIDMVASSGYLDSLSSHMESLYAKNEISMYRQRDSQNLDYLAQSWNEFNSATASYFEVYREQKKHLRSSIEEAKAGKKEYSRKISEILYEIVDKNDSFVLKLLKIVYCLYLLYRMEEKEKSIQMLLEVNKRIKVQARNIMEKSNQVAYDLKQQDIQSIEKSLFEYEAILQGVMQGIQKDTCIMLENHQERNA